MRLLHVADLHLGLTRYGKWTGSASSRVLDFRATLDRFVDTAIGHEVQAAVFAGDTFNNRRETPEDRASFAVAVRTLRLAGITVIVVPGNHDGQTTVGDRASHAFRWLEELAIPNVVVVTSLIADQLLMVGEGDPLHLTALPYPHKRAFDAQLRDMDPDDRVLEAGQLVEAWITAAGEALPDDDVPRLFAGHLTVGGSTAGSETTMKFHWDVAVRPGAFAAFDYAALGHIHRQQQLPGVNAWYAGSPEYIDFAEVEQPKGFLLVDFDRGRPPTVTVIPSGARPMQKVTVRGLRESIAHAILPGAIVHLTVDTGDRPSPAAVNRVLAEVRSIASFVKLDVVRPAATAEQRVPVAGLDILDATSAHLTAHGHPLEPAMTAARQLIAAQGGTS